MQKIKRIFKRISIILLSIFIFPFIVPFFGMYLALTITDNDLDNTGLRFWDF